MDCLYNLNLVFISNNVYFLIRPARAGYIREARYAMVFDFGYWWMTANARSTLNYIELY
jgi:hypothetical protein